MKILKMDSNTLIVKNLSKTNFNELVACFLTAFENYFVKMPTDKNYYKKRWCLAKVDFNLSYGMFFNGRLIGFIINAIDKRKGILTAFNTGTGVIPEYRGQKIVKSIYHYALTDLAQNGITNCQLEVITKGTFAIRSYQSIGFKIIKKYKCFNGKINLSKDSPINLQEISRVEMNWQSLPNQEFYSWDNQLESIKNSDYKCFYIFHDQVLESYFIINPDTGYLAQFDRFNYKQNNGWNRLFLGIKQISSHIKINNVDERLSDKINYLNSIGLENPIDQYEMELKYK